jgi:DNA mismatch repair protein MSH6
MGGKSTLLRQNCIAIILAQLGCFVPAKSFVLSPVDAIFSRIGANDKIMSGESTFMVELTETATIVKNATKHSFLILDELGRGTSSNDGYALAFSVVQYLAEKIKCRTLFSTHFYWLTEQLRFHPFISMYQMEHVKIDNELIFTYKYKPGVCATSYGLECAKLAGIPDYIIQQAKYAAEKLEKIVNNKFEENIAKNIDQTAYSFKSFYTIVNMDKSDVTAIRSHLKQETNHYLSLITAFTADE